MEWSKLHIQNAPQLRNVLLRNVNCFTSHSGISLRGLRKPKHTAHGEGEWFLQLEHILDLLRLSPTLQTLRLDICYGTEDHSDYNGNSVVLNSLVELEIAPNPVLNTVVTRLDLPAVRHLVFTPNANEDLPAIISTLDGDSNPPPITTLTFQYCVFDIHNIEGYCYI